MKLSMWSYLYRLAWAGLLCTGLTACDCDLNALDGGVDQTTTIRDLSTPPDQTTSPDQTTPPDLTQLPDLTEVDLTPPASCADGVLNGTETDVDCGGGVCAPCQVNQICRAGGDCQSGVCGSGGTCAAPTCNDGVRNDVETDVDCGGGTCPACVDGRRCQQGARDCTSQVCNSITLTCSAAACTDNVRNGTETGIDCGGGACPACPAGQACVDGPRDCMSQICDSATNTCTASICTDGVRNGAETDIDCGGGTCPACADGLICVQGARDCLSGVCDSATNTCAVAACNDGVRNGTETGTDCGGGTCPVCPAGQGCADGPRDCMSGVCDSATNTCAAAICNDGVRNGTETDVDCGGGSCPACPAGGICVMGPRDCMSQVCDSTTNTCAAPVCNDGVRNGNETGTDCGGGACPACPAGMGCQQGPRDCMSQVCDSTTNTCAMAVCNDGVRNGAETDIDCGGGTCPACADGLSCQQGPRDCTSQVCGATNTCAAPVCNDSVRNGRETGLDCGGPDCPTCPDGQGCTGNSDCQSNFCGPGNICAEATCANGILDPGETDVDCGGTLCAPCANNLTCVLNRDCASGFCDPNVLLCRTPACTDGVRNGSETDVDCGGGVCPACPAGLACQQGPRDCIDQICDAGTLTCSAPLCNDGVRNGTETGLDCGGGTCPACPAGQGCQQGTRDCISQVCDSTTQTCAMAACNDGVRNGAETGLDCGGGTCPACPAGMGCQQGPRDCMSQVCDSTTQTCAAPACNDGVRNGNETGIDCGGGTCPVCPAGMGCQQGPRDCMSQVCTANICAVAACNDGVRNGTETGTDCGGGACPLCPAGTGCQQGPRDCMSQICDSGTQTCVMATCSDGVRNGAETGTDCGGGTCPVCPAGMGCQQGPRDCMSQVCTANVCAVAACNDTVRNGNETDVDCGGGTCPTCNTGQRCNANGDCQSNICSGPGGTCQAAPTCSDGVRNGNETDVDCGGGTCPACGNGFRCNGNSDCTSGNCSGGVCAAPAGSCTDGIRNGSETDVDCGGGTCPACEGNRQCSQNSDCQEGYCDTAASPRICRATSCRTIRRDQGSGTYTIDPDGAGVSVPFQVYCDMVTDGGGWTLITSFRNTTPGNVQAVNNSTLIMPSTTNATNRGMRLPGVTAIMTVNEDTDNTAFSKIEIYDGLTGTLRGDGSSNITTFQGIIDSLNMNTGNLWFRQTTTPTVDDSQWTYNVRRINTGGCQQVAGRAALAYGDGNHGGANSAAGPSGVSSVGMLWHHWDSECWVSGVTAINLFRCTLPSASPAITGPNVSSEPSCTSPPGTRTYQHFPVTNFWKAVFLR